MGHKIILHTTHQLHALLTSPQFVLTHARKTGYEVILVAPEIIIKRCNTINPTLRMMTPADGVYMTVYSQLMCSENMYEQPLPAELTSFVEGFCYKNIDGLHVGYVIVKLIFNSTFIWVQDIKVLRLYSTERPKLKAITVKCKLAEGKNVNIY